LEKVKNATTGALLGFFLGIIGIIIIVMFPKIEYNPFGTYASPADELRKYKELLDVGL